MLWVALTAIGNRWADFQGYCFGLGLVMGKVVAGTTTATAATTAVDFGQIALIQPS